MELTHEDLIVGLAEVCVIISSELIVAVDHVPDGAHHPLNRVHWADTVSITVHHGNRRVLNVLDWDIRGDPVIFALEIRLSILLEASLDTILEVVHEGAS